MYDYPKLSVMRDAYAITYNRFRSSYVGGAIILLDSAKMAAGQPLTTVYSWLVNNKWRVRPSSPAGALPHRSDPVHSIARDRSLSFHVCGFNPINLIH